MHWHLKGLCYFRIIFSALIMFIVIVAFKRILPYTRINLVVFILLGMLVYALVLYLTGEIKQEARFILAKVKNR